MASIIVPVFNRWDLTKKFINSTLPYLAEDDELIIVDNASTDETWCELNKLAIVGSQNSDVHLKIYHSEINTGFGEGNNLGADIATKEHLIFISNDVVVNGDFIRATESMLRDGIDGDGSTFERVFVGHRLINWDSGWNSIWRYKGKIIPPIAYLQGYYMAISKLAFYLVGGFDRHMFIDYEDLDLAFRLQQAGYRMIEIPSLPIDHTSSGNTFGQLNTPRGQLTEQSLRRFGKKYNFERTK